MIRESGTCQYFYIPQNFQKEATGADYVSVGVTLPDGTAEYPMVASRIESFALPAAFSTPWSAADVAFGWYPSTDTSNDRMAVTIAATARMLIAPFISAIAGLGADTIVVSAALQQPRPGITAIKICEQKTGRVAGQRRIRRGVAGRTVAA